MKLIKRLFRPCSRLLTYLTSANAINYHGSRHHYYQQHSTNFRIVTRTLLMKSSVGLLLFLCFCIFFGYLVSGAIFSMFTKAKSRHIIHRDYPHAEEDIYQSSQFSGNGNPIFFMISKQSYYKSAETRGEGAEKVKPLMNSMRITKKHHNGHPYANDIPRRKGKFWMRISDEVFVYSAHLDTRNFTLPYPMLNNLSRVGDGKEANAEKGGQRIAGDDDDDSDKLKQIILVRIVGIKAVPPLREFIKGDILDWFRMKNELDYSQKYKCELFFTSSSGQNLKQILSSTVTYTVIEEGVKIYAGCYFNCYFTMNSSVYQEIQSATVTDGLQVSMYPLHIPDYPTKLIDVGTLMMMGTPGNSSNSHVNFHQRTLSVCVRPLFGPFDNVEKLAQFISYYHVIGITQFNFYLMSISPRVRKYLLDISVVMEEAAPEERRTLPRVILHDWNVPTGNTFELWDYGTLAALNDCLFANIDQEFVIFVDIDEFIVPRMPNSTSNTGDNKNDKYQPSSLWAIIDSYNRTKTYQYLIRNTFFCHEFCEKVGNDTSNDMNFSLISTTPPPATIQPDAIPALTSSPFPANNSFTAEFLDKMSIFQCLVRTKRIWNAAMRSKFIVNPREVLAVGHHLATKYVKRVDFRFSGYSVQVDPNLGILHHYRECASISSKKHPVLTRLREIDKTILKYKWRVYDYLRSYYLPFSDNQSYSF